MIRAKKSLGQNFLIDKNIINRILEITIAPGAAITDAANKCFA